MFLKLKPRRGRYLLALSALSAIACGGSGLGDATGSTCPSGSTLTYASFGQAFMRDKCLACHADNGPESPKFSTLNEVKASLSDIDRAAAAGPNAVNTYMPQSGSATDAERRQLGEWLACGAPP
jgi:hypothetical protein